MKVYFKPLMEIVSFSVEDCIMASGLAATGTDSGLPEITGGWGVLQGNSVTNGDIGIMPESVVEGGMKAVQSTLPINEIEMLQDKVEDIIEFIEDNFSN